MTEAEFDAWDDLANEVREECLQPRLSTYPPAGAVCVMETPLPRPGAVASPQAGVVW
jgi:hypothetical protein